MTVRSSWIVLSALLWAPARAQDSSSGSGDSGFGRDANGVEQCYCQSPIPSDCVVPSRYPACVGARAQRTVPAQASPPLQGSAPLQDAAPTPKQSAAPSCADAVAIGYQGTFCNENGTLVPIGQVYGKQTSAGSAPVTVSPTATGGAAPRALGRAPAPGTAPTLTLPPSGSSSSGNPQGGLVDFMQPNFTPLNGDQKSFVERMKAQSPPPAAAPPKPAPDALSEGDDSQ